MTYNRWRDPKLRERRKWLRKKFRVGVCYFVQRDDGLVKIGFTSNLPKRYRELQLTVSPNIVLLGSVRASMHYEKRLHKMFATQRVEGEWFFRSDLLILYIRAFADKPNLQINSIICDYNYLIKIHSSKTV